MTLSSQTPALVDELVIAAADQFNTTRAGTLSTEEPIKPPQCSPHRADCMMDYQHEKREGYETAAHIESNIEASNPRQQAQLGLRTD